MSFLHRHRLALLTIFNTVLLLACLPAPVEPTKSVYVPPLTLLTPTPLPPTPTPTPLPAAKPGSVIQDMTRKHESLSTDEIDDLLNAFLPAHTHLPSQYAADTYRIWFRTRNRDGMMMAIQADLRFPKVDVETEFPIFVYGSGTTGIANACATLNEQFAGRNWGDYRSHMLSYATQGYITVIANWQGFDDRDQTHPYFVSELEGYVMLDVTRAVYDFFANPPSDDILARPAQAVFFGGYSQGGHGAFAGDTMASQYAPELNIVGIIGHATAPDVEGLMVDSPRYAPYIVYAYRDFYGENVVDPKDVFLERWMATYDQDVTKCIDDVLTYYANTPQGLFTPQFRNALYNNQLAIDFPEFKARLDLNYSGREVNPSTPAIILHGADDPIVQLHTVNRFVTSMCQEGKNVTYRVYSGIDHFQTRQYSLLDTLAWMQDILSGNTPASDCARFVQ
ncbi:MAG: hypothetical protein JXA89_12790 [Anaerolineae bacterium]|nr:hypothetical protein [Anaerolineae bacterium]